MSKLKSVQDLTRVQEKAQRLLGVRLETETTITVMLGECGTAAGARETIRALMHELAQCQLHAHVATSDCIGECDKAPIVEIARADGSHFRYANIKPDKVPQLVEEHLIQGHPITEWIIEELDA